MKKQKRRKRNETKTSSVKLTNTLDFRNLISPFDIFLNSLNLLKSKIEF